MPRLILMRHAKSDWSGGARDHERPLNPRGYRAAVKLGDWLREQALLPDQVFCSSATRTRETLAGLELPEETETHFQRGLYLATHHNLLAAMRTATGETLLMIGHNPGIGWCAAEIVAEMPGHPRFGQYPTGATLVADFDVPWHEVDWGKAIARHFVVPRDL